MTDHYVGIDVHKTESQVAVIDEMGEVTEEVRVDNDQGNFCRSRNFSHQSFAKLIRCVT
jgi:hypothetical protein